jgi:hypothetical protein
MASNSPAACLAHVMIISTSWLPALALNFSCVIDVNHANSGKYSTPSETLDTGFPLCAVQCSGGAAF